MSRVLWVTSGASRTTGQVGDKRGNREVTQEGGLTGGAAACDLADAWRQMQQIAATSDLFARVRETPACALPGAAWWRRGKCCLCAGISAAAHPFLAALLQQVLPGRPIVMVTEGLKTQEAVHQDLSTWLGRGTRVLTSKLTRNWGRRKTQEMDPSPLLREKEKRREVAGKPGVQARAPCLCSIRPGKFCRMSPAVPSTLGLFKRYQRSSQFTNTSTCGNRDSCGKTSQAG